MVRSHVKVLLRGVVAPWRRRLLDHEASIPDLHLVSFLVRIQDDKILSANPRFPKRHTVEREFLQLTSYIRSLGCLVHPLPTQMHILEAVYRAVGHGNFVTVPEV